MKEGSHRSYGLAAVLTVVSGAAVLIASLSALAAALFAAATVVF